MRGRGCLRYDVATFDFRVRCVSYTTASPGNRVAGSTKWSEVARALPGVAMGIGGGVVGVTTPLGIGLVGAGVAYLVADLLWLQPRVASQEDAGERRARATQEFLDRAMTLRDVGEVAEQFARAVTAGLGPARIVLVAPGTDGDVKLLGPVGSEPTALEGDSTAALVWLGEQPGPVFRDRLAPDDPGAAEVRDLLDHTRCQVALPLRYRGLLLGVGLVGGPAAAEGGPAFYRALRAYATLAMANTFLGASAEGGAALATSIDSANAAQTSLMPEERLHTGAGWALKGVSRPVAECGGDLWAFRVLDDGRVLVVIADATGHGAAPALLVAAARGALDGVWQLRGSELEPAELLSALNRAVYRTGRRRYLMTAFALILEPAKGEVVYANAGQNFPYVLSGEKIEALVARGNALGSAAEASFDTERRTLAPGDRVMLYTDGLVEAENSAGEPLGERRFRAAVSRLAGTRLQRLPEALLAVAEEHAGDRSIDDDLTLVLLERAAAREEGEA